MVISWPWGAGVCGTRRGVPGHVGGAEAGQLEPSFARDFSACALAAGRCLAKFVTPTTRNYTRRCEDVLGHIITLCSPLHGVCGPLEQFLWSEVFGTKEKRESGYVLVWHGGRMCREIADGRAGQQRLYDVTMVLLMDTEDDGRPSWYKCEATQHWNDP